MMLLELFWTFFKIGALTFGGGYAMIPLIQGEVLKMGWLDAESLVNLVAVSESTPGPFAVNAATYIGTVTAGPAGALSATLGVVLPSFLVILAVSKGYRAFRKSRLVESCMKLVKPAAVGLIGAAALSIGRTALFDSGVSMEAMFRPPFWIALGVFAVMLVLALKKAHPILLILLSALAGLTAGAGASLMSRGRQKKLCGRRAGGAAPTERIARRGGFWRGEAGCRMRGGQGRRRKERSAAQCGVASEGDGSEGQGGRLPENRGSSVPA
ncbi:MAG: chromate transporter [Clostridia bacterium]|nr:chromate transporter [Clostridia bacterium]